MENDQEDHKNVSLSLIADYGASDSDSDDTETRSNDNTGNEDSDAAELSEMVLKNNIINACAHGPLSRSSAGDRAEVSRHMIIDSSETGVSEYEVTEYRDIDSDSDTGSSSDSSDSDVESVKDVEELSSGDETGGAAKSKKIEPPKVQGELELDDLPPIEDLAISLPSQETVKIGTIASIVDRLVIVRALPDTPAVDLDSVLFLENGSKALGKVFDVFGPVSEPHYCVRFNSAEHVRARGAAPGLPVYIAPRTPHTTYVFLSQLMNVKGTDASWLNDLEPPPHQVEYSDDEEERRATRARKEQAKLNRQEEAAPEGEASRGHQPAARRPPEPRRAQRPSDSSSRFGGAPSRGRNPFAAGSRRSAPAAPRHPRPWAGDAARTPPPHPGDPGGRGPFGAPPFPPMFPLGFDPNSPPPFVGNPFRFGGHPMMGGGPMGGPRFPPGHPAFGASYRGGGGALPRWVNNIPPPPPGT